MSISRFGFITLLVVYLGLLFAEYLRPGFVSNAMNAHVLWIAIVGTIIVEQNGRSADDRLERDERRPDQNITRPIRSRVIPIAQFALITSGLLLALIVWHLGTLFGDMRLFFALAVGILPFVLLK
ncbi:MAG: hypothetical protein AAB473_02040 [Patescibacteria group bacterium]